MNKIYSLNSFDQQSFQNGEFLEMDLPFGVFGENLTTEGLLESDVNVGDRFRIGTAELIVTQPREPYFKLGIRFGRGDIIKRFARSERTGFYLAIEKTGELGAGDEIEFLSRETNQPSIADVVRERFNI